MIPGDALLRIYRRSVLWRLNVPPKYLNRIAAVVLLTATASATADNGFNAGSLWIGWGDQGSGRVDLPFSLGQDPQFSWSMSMDHSDVLPQSDGSLILVGTAISNSGPMTGLARLRPDGTLDPNFGLGGFSGNPTPQYASAALVDFGGQLLVTGAGSINGSSLGWLCRFNSVSGSPTVFEGSAMNCTDLDALAGGRMRPKVLQIQPGVGILVAGSLELENLEADSIVMRLKFDGSLDTTFHSPQGFARYRPPGWTSAGIDQLRLTTNGKLILASTGTFDQNGVMFGGSHLARAAANGVIEPNWPIESIQDDYTIDFVAVDIPNEAEDDVVLTRFYGSNIHTTERIDGATGQIEPGGEIYGAMFLFPGGFAPSGMTQDNTDNFVIASRRGYTSEYQSGVSRLLPNSQPDASFGSGGFVYLNYEGDPDPIGNVFSTKVAVQNDAVYAARPAGPDTSRTLIVYKLHGNPSDLIFRDGFE